MRRVSDIDDVRARVRGFAARRARRDDEFTGHAGEAERLIESLPEFDPVWERYRVVVRTAELETEHGTAPFVETVVLPDVKHSFDLVLSMLNFFREQRGLPEASMPLFLQPDEVAHTLREGTRCHCDEERSLSARRRSARRLGRRGTKRWQKQRFKVLDRDDWKCRVCGAEKDVHVHSTDPEAPNSDVDSFVTLCRAHHVIAPSANGLDPATVEGIRSQLAVVFQRGRIDWVGFVFGKDYFLIRS